ncbi:MAG: IS1595 family transposase [Candidatus Izemoplasmatales bacterium]
MVKKDKDGKQHYYCYVCRKNHRRPYFHDLTFTVFHGKKLKTEKIIMLSHYFSNNDSAHRTYKTSMRINNKVSLKTTWKYFKLFREGILKFQSRQPLEEKHWEIDEIYISFRDKKHHQATKRKLRGKSVTPGRGTELKTPIMCIISKNRLDDQKKRAIKTIPLENLSSQYIKEKIDFEIGLSNMQIVETDEFPSYKFMGKVALKHYEVNHKKHFVNHRTGANTNIVENFNQNIRYYFNVYRFCDTENIELYMNEIIYRYNNIVTENDILKMCIMN